MRLLIALGLLVHACSGPAGVSADTSFGVRPLQASYESALAVLPSPARILLDSAAIERFLVELDGMPPDWSRVYGQGHQDPGHDERLFALNRERDALREGNAALQSLLTVSWIGELSEFDEQAGGFRVAVGPKFHETGWGIVRFKYEDLPARLVALAGESTMRLRARLQDGEQVAVDVLLTGRLIQEESLVYDFSHEEEGRGLIMPVVRVEAVEFVLNDPGGRQK